MCSSRPMLRMAAMGQTLPFDRCPLIDRFLGATTREQTDRFRPTLVIWLCPAERPRRVGSGHRTRYEAVLRGTTRSHGLTHLAGAVAKGFEQLASDKITERFGGISAPEGVMFRSVSC